MIIIKNVNLFFDIKEVALLSVTIGLLSIYSFTTEFINRHKKSKQRPSPTKDQNVVYQLILIFHCVLLRSVAESQRFFLCPNYNIIFKNRDTICVYFLKCLIAIFFHMHV